MLVWVGTNDIDMDPPCIVQTCDFFPFVTGEFDGVAAIGDHGESDAQVIGCDAIGEAVAFALDIDTAQIAQCLFDGIDAQEERAGVLCEALGEGGLA